jgi:hypothetical protein
VPDRAVYRPSTAGNSFGDVAWRSGAATDDAQGRRSTHVDDIEVPAGEPDDYLSARVAAALARTPEVASLDISVRVVGDAVLVSGTLESVTQREHALAVTQAEVEPRPVRDGLTVRELHDPEAPEDLP